MGIELKLELEMEMESWQSNVEAETLFMICKSLRNWNMQMFVWKCILHFMKFAT